MGLKNKADSLIISTKKSLKEYGDKVSSADQEQLTSLIKSLEDAIKNESIASIKQQIDSLTQSSMRISQQVHSSSSPGKKKFSKKNEKKKKKKKSLKPKKKKKKKKKK